MDRLHLLDAQFLHLEDRYSPMHIACICIFDGCAPSADAMRRLFAAKLHLAPRHRQRIRTLPLELGRPVWVDDPRFDLDYHLRRTALPSPGDDEALCSLMARLLAQRLDRDRPLWEWWVVEGLRGDRWAVISKVHHSMVDGVSGLDLLSAILDPRPEVSLPEPVPWTPEREPSGPQLVRDAWAGLAHDTLALTRLARERLQQPRAALGALRELQQGTLTLLSRLRTTRASSLEGQVGSQRVYAHTSVPLQDVRAVRKARGGTVNDVALALIAAAYRALLLHRKEDPSSVQVRTLIPVSVRKPSAKGAVDNQLSALLCDLPVQISDPIERFETVMGEMRRLKESHMAEAGERLLEMGDLAPPMLVGPLTRLSARLMHRLPQRSVSTIVTNVPGPPVPLYCLGSRMTEFYPHVPTLQGMRLGTSILSYDGQLGFGFSADRDSTRDVKVVAEAVERALGELKEAALGRAELDARGRAVEPPGR